MRTCVGCGQCRPKKELVRVVRTPEGEILADKTGRKNGRGAYLCGDPACFALARKRRAFSRTLEVPVGPEILDRLERELFGGEENEE